MACLSINQPLYQYTPQENGDSSLDTGDMTSICSIVETPKPTIQQLRFCYRTAQKTLTALKEHNYTHFDAKTTANCCHGISLLARDLIFKARQYDINDLSTKIETQLKDAKCLDANFQIPSAIYQLSQMFLLSYIRDTDSVMGGRSAYAKLKEIEPDIKTNFYSSFGRKLQRKYANMVANIYEQHFYSLPSKSATNSVPTKLWAKYVSAPYLRTDINGIKCAPCLFSMQVFLASLNYKKATIAVINDIEDLSPDKQHKKYIKILKGDGNNCFTEFSEELAPNEPITVFEGCSTNTNPNEVTEQMDKMLSDFPKLVLACDTHYPQFPKAVLANNPIVPEEELLREVIENERSQKGVKAQDPSLFCLNHIYLWSWQQLQEVLNKKREMTGFKIPTILQS